MKHIIEETTQKLFGSNYFDDNMSDEYYYELVNTAKELIKKFGWEKVFSSWKNFLYQNCKTYEQTFNFANWFVGYDGYAQIVENPYEFLGYFYYRIDMKQHGEEAMTIMDTISITILSNAGYRKQVGWGENPYYVPELDPKMVASIEEWRKKDKA